jgi:hypothetical protein
MNGNTDMMVCKAAILMSLRFSIYPLSYTPMELVYLGNIPEHRQRGVNAGPGNLETGPAGGSKSRGFEESRARTRRSKSAGNVYCGNGESAYKRDGLQ